MAASSWPDCTRGHRMSLSSAEGKWKCKLCHKHTAEREKWRCGQCNEDYCFVCFSWMPERSKQLSKFLDGTWKYWSSNDGTGLLTTEVLQEINKFFPFLSTKERLQCLSCMVHAKPAHLNKCGALMQSIIDQAIVDHDPWVQAMGKLLNGFPGAGAINTNQVDSEFTYRLVQVLGVAANGGRSPPPDPDKPLASFPPMLPEEGMEAMLFARPNVHSVPEIQAKVPLSEIVSESLLMYSDELEAQGVKEGDDWWDETEWVLPSVKGASSTQVAVRVEQRGLKQSSPAVSTDDIDVDTDMLRENAGQLEHLKGLKKPKCDKSESAPQRLTQSLLMKHNASRQAHGPGFSLEGGKVTWNDQAKQKGTKRRAGASNLPA